MESITEKVKHRGTLSVTAYVLLTKTVASQPVARVISCDSAISTYLFTY